MPSPSPPRSSPAPRRLACVALPTPRLQLLLAQRPSWRGRPVAVVAGPSPLAPLVELDAEAYRLGLVPGMRHATAAALVPGLRAATVADAELVAVETRLTELLARFSPRLEPVAAGTGCCWLDLQGLGTIFRSPAAWARAVVEALAAAGLRANVVVGFRRLATLVMARTCPGVTVLPSPASERRTAGATPLEQLGLAADAWALLDRLGCRTLGDLFALPAVELHERLGPDVHVLAKLARDEGWEGLAPLSPPIAHRRSLIFDEPEHDTARLLFAAKRLLDPLLDGLPATGDAVTGLDLVLDTGHDVRLTTTLRPAEATRDPGVLLDLLRLWLEGHPLAAPVQELGLSLSTTRHVPEQLALFAARPRRDPAAARRALARLRAELGDAAVTRAVLHDAHLPEERFSFEPLDDLPCPTPPTEVPLRPLVRRFFRPPHLATVRAAPRPNELERLESGWWRGALIRRIYALVPNDRGQIDWVLHIPGQPGWKLQGRVE